MKIDYYKNLITSLPVRQQSFTTKRSTWIKAEKKIDWLNDLNDILFENQHTLCISRYDIFKSSSMLREMILKTIYWGYPSGMRGNHFVNIMQSIPKLEIIFDNLRSKSSLSSNDFNELAKTFKDISGLGLSTFSKLLYFLCIKFNDHPCLIIDQRLIDVFKKGLFEEYSSLRKINEYNKEVKYLNYLELTHTLAAVLQTKGENIEQFLFIFGNTLKIDSEG